MGGPLDGTLSDVATQLQTRTLSSRELVEACLARIEERDDGLGAWERVYEEDAFEQAARADERLSRRSVRRLGHAHPLCGVPVGFKDVLAIADRPLTGGSRALHDNVPTEDATAVARLRAVGMILLGHHRSQEFASGSSPQTSANPWDPRYSPGGSSNGSGAAVGARMVPVALGTDVAGSIRRPASACGLSGVMGTYGSVSNRGILPTAPTSTQIGTMAITVRDAALVFWAIAGADGYDPSRPDAGFDHGAGDAALVPTRGAEPLAGRKLGVLRDFDEQTDPGIGAIFETFLADLERLGADLVAVGSPAPCPPEFYPNPGLVAFHRGLFERRGHLYSEYQRKFVAASLADAAGSPAVDLYAAQAERSAYSRAWADRFSELALDALVSPGQVQPTPRLGEDLATHNDLAGFGTVDIRRMWNVAGFPVVSVQMGRTTPDDMPVGAQFVGAPWTEHGLGQLGVDYQQHTDHHLRVPGE